MKAPNIALFLLPSITVAGKIKNKESTSMASDDEILTFDIDVICGSLEEVFKHGFEYVLLKCMRVTL